MIGGMAMIQQGFVRATEDIDLLVDVSLQNEEKIRKALAFLPDKAVLEIKHGDLDTYEVIRVADEIVVDLMKSACGIDFSQAASKIISIEIQGIKIPFANIDLLIELKQSAREKDKIDLQFLKHKKSNKK
ncbi:MAG: hypothetical protein HY072_03545 [Deltaproteobacteria bacterium]|nr:hypothetical protein [Deltaproteobacteria bacterium]